MALAGVSACTGAAESEPIAVKHRALAAKAVRARFGAGFRPATSKNAVEVNDPSNDERRGCLFLQPTHATRVWLAVSPVPVDDTDASRVAGHRAVTDGDSGDERAEIAASLAVDANEAAEAPSIEVSVSVQGSRGVGGSAEPAGTAQLSKLRPMVADVLEQHFG